MNKVLPALAVLLVVVGGFYIMSNKSVEAPAEPLPEPVTSSPTSTPPMSNPGQNPAPAPSPSPNSPASTGKCYVGGCSSQICSDQPDMVSTCEWREEYACYKTAKCERQASGQCGWTPTAELNMCLKNSQSYNLEPVVY